MALFSTISHKLRATSWRFRDNTIDFKDTSTLLNQLRSAQNGRQNNLDRLSLDKTGTIYGQYRLSLAPKGRPEYFEYLLLNNQKLPFALINGIIGFTGSNGWPQGLILASTIEGELTGSYTSFNHQIEMDLLYKNIPLKCIWFPASRSEGSSCEIRYNLNNSSEIIISVKGRSRNEELYGSAHSLNVFNKNLLLLKIYPEGAWTFNPLSLFKRFIKDIVPLVTICDPFFEVNKQDFFMGEYIILTSLITSRSLSWPLLPFDSNSSVSGSI